MNNGEKILLVEDDRDFSESLAIMMRMRGHELVTVFCAEDAMAQIERERFGLILIDFRLPGMSGGEFLDWVHRQTPQTSTVLMTGCDRNAPELDSVKSGAVDKILFKPFKIKDLLSIVENLLK